MAAGTGVRAAVAVGGLNERTQLQSIRKGAQVLIATPGRLYDFLSRKLVDLGGVRMLVLDEADRMLDMGFLPTIKSIMAAIPSDRQTLFFSATIESSVKHLVETHVRNAVRIEVGSTTKPIEQVDLHLYEVEQDRKLGLLARMLREEQGSFLVFARTKRGADKLSKKLARGGVKTTAIHGDRSQSQRNQALRGFQEGYYRVLVATDVAARGIHVEGISHVVNYDLPQVPGGLHSPGWPHGTRGRSRNGFDLRHTLRARRRCAHRAHPRHPAGAAPCVARRSPRAEADGSRRRHSLRLAPAPAACQIVCAPGQSWQTRGPARCIDGEFLPPGRSQQPSKRANAGPMVRVWITCVLTAPNPYGISLPDRPLVPSQISV